MEVYENINTILKQRKLTKRWFAKRLRELEPKLKSTGEIPTEKAIYGYLNGTSNIKIELIPYIAEVLNIDENKLFTQTIQYTMETTNYEVKEPDIQYNKDIDEDTKKLIELLPFAPKPLIQKLIKELERNKKVCEDI